MIIGPKSGIRLHNILVKSAFNAPMQFFEATDSSVLLNRFSQDMTLIDMQLPLSAFGFIMSE
jgi:ATP-binding cassette subfamily C (CFTR/MRP) protein 1